MAIVARLSNLSQYQWSISGPNLQRLGLFDQVTSTFVIDPPSINALGGTKNSTLSDVDLLSLQQTFAANDFQATAADFADTNWLAKGWTVSNYTVFLGELANWIINNFTSRSFNAESKDVDVILMQGNISGTNYTVPFAYYGNQGITINTPVAFTKITAGP